MTARLLSVACRALCGGVILVAATFGTARAAVQKQALTPLDHKAFFHPELSISTAHAPLSEVQAAMPNRQAWQAFLQLDGTDRLASGRVSVFVDPRSGAVSNLMGAFPLIPGRGAGNTLSLQSLGEQLAAPVPAVDAGVVARAVRRFVVEHAALLGVEVAQLGPAKAVQVTPELWQVEMPQFYRGIPVRHARLAGSISQGNLVVFGAEAWGNVRRLSPAPKLSAADALAAGFAYAEGRASDDTVLASPRLEVVPLAPARHQKGEGFGGPIGAGYRHRLVWTFVFRRLPSHARWEVLVDAHNGEVMSFQDVNLYAEREVTGGVYPLANTEICSEPAQCGEMQLGHPMPFANTGLAAPQDFTSSAGTYDFTAASPPPR
jgi:hypothetical protein